MMVKVVRNGAENGRSAYLAKCRALGKWMTFATIVFDGGDWIVRKLATGRIDRFATLREAKDEAIRSAY
jgi:hypothetical protein